MSHPTYPWIDIPADIATAEQVQAFDAARCREGCKAFLRPLTEVEHKAAPETLPPLTAVLVQEMKLGARLRSFVHAQKLGSN